MFNIWLQTWAQLGPHVKKKTFIACFSRSNCILLVWLGLYPYTQAYLVITALKQPQSIFKILNTFEYQKLDRHLQAELPVVAVLCATTTGLNMKFCSNKKWI